MAIKSTSPPKKKTEKVSKKVIPKNEHQKECKFCGKSVPRSAYFCPHCYGKL